jgi:hypothetical protein
LLNFDGVVILLEYLQIQLSNTIAAWAPSRSFDFLKILKLGAKEFASGLYLFFAGQSEDQ